MSTQSTAPGAPAAPGTTPVSVALGESTRVTLSREQSRALLGALEAGVHLLRLAPGAHLALDARRAHEMRLALGAQLPAPPPSPPERAPGDRERLRAQIRHADAVDGEALADGVEA